MAWRRALRVVGLVSGIIGGTAVVPRAWSQEAVSASLPEAPEPALPLTLAADPETEGISLVSHAEAEPEGAVPFWAFQGTPGQGAPPSTDAQGRPLGPDGRPIRPQTGRIFGIFPNFVAVSGGTKPRPAGWGTDFRLANKQAYDYSSFGFLLISSGLAYAETSHPSLNTENGGNAIFWAYLWRGFLDKTDGTYQGTFFFPALLHEDTRYYALGTGSVKRRLGHAVASVVVAHDYNQRPIPNIAGLVGRAGAQAVSTTYYPAGSEGFGVLAEKYGYSTLRNVIYAVVREFSPDAQARVHLRQRADASAGGE